MATLTSNDEQVMRGTDASPEEFAMEGEEGTDNVVANKREFFHEIDEVREALKKVIQPDLSAASCRETCERIGNIWGQYQEQPGLLDPFLEEMIEPLMEAIGSAVRQSPRSPQSASPNLHLLSSLLYLLTTVRGYKTVSRFFPHEAADLEPCLESAEEEAAAGKTETWSTLYCLTLWLGMVLLTPFDLKSIDSGGAKSLSDRILALGLQGLHSTSRTRDASAWMLAKFFTRPDVTAAGALQSFLSWTKSSWLAKEDGDGAISSITGLAFVRAGALQAWNQTLKVAPRSVLKTIWMQVLELTLRGPAGNGDEDFGRSSNLRKLRVAVSCRAGLVALPPRLAPWRYDRGARSLLVNFAQATGGDASQAAAGINTGDVNVEEDDDEEDAPELVEEVVELLLSSLSDADTVVRWASAKGIGRITNRLSRDFGDQVLESLLERCFSFRETDKAWHGGCLALAELTRRGLLLPDRLPTVIPLVCQALHFEQISGNHAVGQHVRDAACYVCWAFARAYAPDVLQPFVADLARALIQVAVYDREINCRRAAAAAVQENVGRQGTFPNGIDVVTIADYWTLSGRKQAYLDVAPQLANLSEGGYRKALIEHLVDRKLAHQDLQIRLLASQALAKLAEEPSEETLAFLNSAVLPKLLERAMEAPPGTGAASVSAKVPVAAGAGPTAGTVQAKHGAVAGAAALTEVLQEKVSAENQTAIRNLVPALEKARAYRGRGGEVVRQAACRLLACVAAAKAWPFKEATAVRYLQTVDECARHTTDSIAVAAADALGVLASVRFTPELCVKCVDNYLAGFKKADETVSARRGYALCLGAMPVAALGDRRRDVLTALCKEVKGSELPGGKDQEDPTTRQYAMLALGRLCTATSLGEDEMGLLLDALEAAMADYALDRRGDVGSWVREVATEVIAALLEAQRHEPSDQAPSLPDSATSTKLLALMMQQAVEKIDRLRERIFGLLRRLLCTSEEAACDDGMTLAYRRVCHSEAYDALVIADTACRASPSKGRGKARRAWPPGQMDALSSALQRREDDEVLKPTVSSSSSSKADPLQAKADTNAAVFDALVPLLAYEEYRPALMMGLVVSVGGLTEHTAKDAKRALLRHLTSRESAASEVCSELLRIFERAGFRDSEPEARRLLAPLLNTLGILLAQDLVPQSFAADFLEKTSRAVRNTRDIVRLRAAVAALIGLLKWPGAVRRKSLSTLLQFLGYSFPTVRQATAQALYIRLLEEEGDLDLSSGEASFAPPPRQGASADSQELVPATVVAEVLELISITPWGTDDEAALASALREVYAKLRIDLPTGGRSILAPKKAGADAKPREAQYADLVRENHY
eukprot:TRINITY_DN78205_c0_g1_i1.p1 TRINITY_DN78205_c0_g1~~TRINITY_DN78205_c0_g1_i1.p1  ORF type:complete len:1345 (-),score=315.69 TRINITY_DN78205_c0_g1_i1:44-4051(-)